MEEKHIIVVDDDPAIQDAVKMILEHKGYRITTFPRGEKLLEEHLKLPDLFILDKQLPGIDGLEICRYIKSQDAMKHVPVLIFSATPLIGPLAKAACADDFLEKPFKMKELREAVQRLIGDSTN